MFITTAHIFLEIGSGSFYSIKNIFGGYWILREPFLKEQ